MVFQRCKEYNLKLAVDKCEFVSNEIVYLGYKISKNGIMANPRYVSKCLKMKLPRNQHELRQYTGTLQWLSKFIANLADYMIAFNKLLQKNVPWHWGNNNKMHLMSYKG